MALISELLTRQLAPAPAQVNLTRFADSIRIESTIPGVPHMLRPNGVAVQEYASDPRGYFDPGTTLTYRTNSLGFRGREVSREKVPGTLRILGFGDSFTFGYGVRREDTFLSVLEGKLDASNAVSSEVLNLGVGGFDTAHEVSLLRHLGLAFEPDLVLICFFLNDANSGSSSRLLNTPHREPAAFWRRHSRLLDLLAFRVSRRLAAKQLVQSYRGSFDENAAGWVEARDALVRANALSRECGFELALMIFPVLWRLSDDYPFAEIHEKLRTFAATAEIPTLDLLPAFSGHDGPELWVHPTDQHPNEVAHAIAGEALYRFLGERRLLRIPDRKTITCGRDGRRAPL
jgi:lysophospholipase L1-like esterase